MFFLVFFYMALGRYPSSVYSSIAYSFMIHCMTLKTGTCTKSYHITLPQYRSHIYYYYCTRQERIPRYWQTYRQSKAGSDEETTTCQTCNMNMSLSQTRYSLPDSTIEWRSHIRDLSASISHKWCETGHKLILDRTG